MRLYSYQQRPFNEIRHVAIAIAIVHDQQNHVGILYKDDDLNDVKLGHLAWHCMLKESSPSDSYMWIDPLIPTPRARQVAARCRQILRENKKGGIPYAFSPPNDCFDELSGKFLLGKNRVGLTCATFVFAVFDAAGIRLAEYHTWPEQRAGDAEWQKFIIEQLEQSNVGTDHIARVKGEMGLIRYRPEDAAACAASDRLPCSFALAEPLSREILWQLQLLGKPLHPAGGS